MESRIMTSAKKAGIRKILTIITSLITAVVLIFCLLFYLIINSYINKINYEKTDEPDINSNQIEILHTDEDLTDVKQDYSDAIEEIDEMVRKSMEDTQTSIISDDDITNILLIGCDGKEKNIRGRSDTIIIISVNRRTKTITVTSVMRDIYLHIPGQGNNRINAAYAFGGANLLMETIKHNLNIEVNRYVAVDFYAFVDVIDALGGVCIEVSEKEMNAVNDSIESMNIFTGVEELNNRLTEPGLHLLNGKQALAYVRIRKVGNADFERTERQRRVLRQVFEGIKNMNLLELNDLANAVLPQVTTNLTKGEIFSLILGLPSYIKYELQELRIPVEGSYTDMRVRGMAVLNIDFGKNIKKIYNKIYQEEKD